MESCTEHSHCGHKITHFITTIVTGIVVTAIIIANVKKLSNLLHPAAKDDSK